MLEKNISYSDDQAQAYDTISDILRSAGVDISNGRLDPQLEGKTSIAAVIGKAGSGKTLLLGQLYHALKDTGMNIVSGDYEPKRAQGSAYLGNFGPHQQSGKRFAQPRRASHHDPPYSLHPNV